MNRIRFRTSDMSEHSIPEFYLDTALEIDPDLVVLRNSTDPNVLELTALDYALLWSFKIQV